MISFPLFSQKVETRVIQTKGASVSDWQILDQNYFPVITGNEFPGSDTAVFSIEANKSYFFEVSVTDIKLPDTCLYSLSLEGRPIILVRSGIGTGDHFLPFFSGVRFDPTSKITGGTDADISEYPWQVFLEAGGYTCGGSIIGGKWILTAAHCVKDKNEQTIPASQIDVIVGANNPRIPSQGKKYIIDNVIVHEMYSSQTNYNDIALLKLKDSIDFPNAKPIKIVSEPEVRAGATNPGVMAWVTGYGLTKISPATFPSKLQKIQLPIVSNFVASIIWKNIPETDMMAGYPYSTMDACSGDSGGPLIVPWSNGYRLAGVVSWGSSKCDTYGAYTRLSMFESWITGKTGIEITFRAPVPKGDSIICPGTTSSQYIADAVNGATSYTWSLSPDDAGTISGLNENANVTWTSGYTGPVSIKLQVTRDRMISEISKLKVNLSKQTGILEQPKDTILCAGQPVILKVKTEGYNLNYTWYKNGNRLFFTIGNEVNIPQTATDNTGIYYCNAEGKCGIAVSANAALTVLPVTKINSVSPDSEVLFGNNLDLNVDASGHNLKYQWYKDNNLLSYDTSSTLQLHKANANDIGHYKVNVSGTCGTETSSQLYVYVNRKDISTEPEFIIWPTVINDIFKVAMNNEKKYKIILYNMAGRLIKEIRNCQFNTTVNIGNQPSGIYFVTIDNDDFRKTVKVIKR